MNAILPLELLPHRPLAKSTVAVLRDVVAAAQATRIDWFVGGASARDILITHVHDVEPMRATLDVDIGISIQSWDAHAQLRQALVGSGNFEEARHSAHRLNYRVKATGERTWLDIVPFGGVQDAAGEIAWPPDRAVRMNVAGFQQALDAAVPVRIAADVIAPVASLPAQAMLKLIAWQDRHAVDRKDAIDLLFLMARYAQAGNLDRLYADAFALVERHGHDPDIAGAALLGHDTAHVATGDAGAQILAIIRPDDASPAILDHMLGHRAPIDAADSVEHIAALFDAFRRAFREAFDRAV